MNALVDKKMIRLLYQASQAGVKVELLVRGICCLIPGIPGISDNITVTSIVGRFLEHSRIFYFNNGGNEEVYLGSADLMPRNLNHRVEVDFPVQDKELIRVVRDEILATNLEDQAKARHMTSDGKYVRDPGLRQKGRAEQSGNFSGAGRETTGGRSLAPPQIVNAFVAFWSPAAVGADVSSFPARRSPQSGKFALRVNMETPGFTGASLSWVIGLLC